MGAHTIKRNIHTFYIRSIFLPIWDKFISLIKKDPKFTQLRYKEDAGLISAAIMQLISDYVQIREHELSEGKE